jgi:ribosomal 50S subunit-associated protein YjgA (DUF615 family)
VVPQRRLVKRRRGNRARPALGLRRHQRAKLEVLVPGDRALTMVVSKYPHGFTLHAAALMHARGLLLY